MGLGPRAEDVSNVAPNDDLNDQLAVFIMYGNVWCHLWFYLTTFCVKLIRSESIHEFLWTHCLSLSIGFVFGIASNSKYPFAVNHVSYVCFVSLNDSLRTQVIPRSLHLSLTETHYYLLTDQSKNKS